MPRHCSVGGCRSRDNRDTRNAGITFHKLPKGESRRSLWITNAHRAKSWDPQTDFVYFCSKHFTPQSFELSGCSGIRRLKEDAFPTIFDIFSEVKSKRARPVQKQDVLLRKASCSGEQENLHHTDSDQPSESRTDHKSGAATEEVHEDVPAPSQEQPALQQVPQEKCSLSPHQDPTSSSPEQYMRRLPPPVGFYLSKEHSYAQLCPLLWRRRYNQAIDCLEKTLRQLHAARRRENRLRSTVLRLRDKQLKQALLVSKDDCKDRGGWTPGVENRGDQGDLNHKDSETAAGAEVCQDRRVDGLSPDTSSGSEEEVRCCFYCGRAQVQDGGQLTQKASQTSAGSRTQIVGLERPRTGGVVMDVATSKVQLHTPALSLTDSPKQSWLFDSKQKLCLSVMRDKESEVIGQEQESDLLHKLLFIQDSADGQVILVPVPVDEQLQSIGKMEGVPGEGPTILVSEVDLPGNMENLRESSGRASRDEPSCGGKHSEQRSVVSSTVVEMTEDIRERLKEHLEGFHLQLSTEFLN
ncbi:uncharacterized protein V6R79_011743 [Siganus canaliculatus]